MLCCYDDWGDDDDDGDSGDGDDDNTGSNNSNNNNINVNKNNIINIKNNFNQTCAEHFENIGSRCKYCSCAPPTMMDGPFLAPSSPPLTPIPMKCMPFRDKLASRLRVKTV